jgi:hypothetical protein
MFVEFLPALGGIIKPDQAGNDEIKIIRDLPGPRQEFIFRECPRRQKRNGIFPFRIRKGNLAFDDPPELLKAGGGGAGRKPGFGDCISDCRSPRRDAACRGDGFEISW